jgi:hypothetical protein
MGSFAEASISRALLHDHTFAAAEEKPVGHLSSLPFKRRMRKLATATASD